MTYSTGWPDGFMWGTGASSTQERAGHAPLSGDGNGFGTRYAEDFALYASLGLTHNRLGVDWAQLEPEPGKFSQQAVEHYRQVLTAARDAGVSAWVCLHHFTLPRWFAASGAFLDPANPTGPWARYVDFVGDAFADLVYGWKPVNEMNYYPDLAYRSTMFPPARSSADEAMEVTEAIHLATAEAAVRLKQTGRPVPSIFGLTPFFAHDDSDATRAVVSKLTAHQWDAGLKLFREGVLRLKGRPPVERPDLAGSFDLIGFSYYAGAGIRDGQGALHPPGTAVGSSGYGIWADGLGVVLDRLHALLPGTPLIVAEYGIGADDDTQRAEYIRRGIHITAEALERGVDVRGFFHWTGVDNYEWVRGMDVKFGMIGTDRQPKASARVAADAALVGRTPTEARAQS